MGDATRKRILSSNEEDVHSTYAKQQLDQKNLQINSDSQIRFPNSLFHSLTCNFNFDFCIIGKKIEDYINKTSLVATRYRL